MKFHQAGFFLFALPYLALATTTLRQDGQPVELGCDLRVEMLGVESATQKYRTAKSAGVDQRVYWRVKVLEASGSPPLCPTETELSVRVRGADFRMAGGQKIFTYPVHLWEPEAGSPARVKVRLIEGTESLTRRSYREWTLQELARE